MPDENVPATTTQGATNNDKPVCGLVMPISAMDGCSEQHWSEVKDIFTEAIESADFVANLVSNADDVGIIQKRIIQNLYENPIVVCDVSAKNPNVMFELGLRLAFDKPTIIVKDDQTSYTFDTAPIEHLPYPRDLRFSKMVAFKKALADKIVATYKRSQEDPEFTPFLKHFGKFTVAKLDSKEVSKEDFIIQQLGELREAMKRAAQWPSVPHGLWTSHPTSRASSEWTSICGEDAEVSVFNNIAEETGHAIYELKESRGYFDPSMYDEVIEMVARRTKWKQVYPSAERFREFVITLIRQATL